MEEVRATAHGKILWLGGYTILEKPNLGYVSTVDASIHATVRKYEDNRVTIEASLFGAKVRGKLNTKTGNISINVPEELKLAKTAAQAALMYVLGTGRKITGIHLRTTNDAAFIYRIYKRGAAISKGGLGSSAAVTVATIAAILKAFDVDPHENEALHKLAQISHSVATGKIGSGYDIAAATYGDIIYSRYSPSILENFPKDFDVNEVFKMVSKRWDYSVAKLPLPEIFEVAVAKFARKSAITTAMVGSVNKFKNENPEAYGMFIGMINKETLTAISTLEKINKFIDVEANVQLFKTAFNKSRLFTKTLGVMAEVEIEPDDATRLIDKTVENGAFVARLPGSGGYDSIAAIVMKGEKSKEIKKVLKFWGSIPYLQVMDVKKNYSSFETETRKLSILHFR